ncbi:hypothetical protein L1987_03800 [Smallanthus sonchifolius]|uniref:Uncharacterized protein n=1 Tax=Smallanthus sonchifolius TaxID=185202 RepID=A0ACB9KBP0_9ASTR|nr:hypothetical protein L1987_03800 [Smallanthus sonchifolius]
MLPNPLSGIDASVVATIQPASDGIVSAFIAIDDKSVWIAHGDQISIYNWNLTHASTVRTHLDSITSTKQVTPSVCISITSLTAVESAPSSGSILPIRESTRLESPPSLTHLTSLIGSVDLIS